MIETCKQTRTSSKKWVQRRRGCRGRPPCKGCGNVTAQNAKLMRQCYKKHEGSERLCFGIWSEGAEDDVTPNSDLAKLFNTRWRCLTQWNVYNKTTKVLRIPPVDHCLKIIQCYVLVPILKSGKDISTAPRGKKFWYVKLISMWDRHRNSLSGPRPNIRICCFNCSVQSCWFYHSRIDWTSSQAYASVKNLPSDQVTDRYS